MSAYGEERKINSDVKDKHAHNKASAQIINHLGFNVTIRLDDNLRLVNEDDNDKKFLIYSCLAFLSLPSKNLTNTFF